MEIGCTHEGCIYGMCGLYTARGGRFFQQFMVIECGSRGKLLRKIFSFKVLKAC